ncbi:hypothetical protein K1T71_009230 [Dendrolimus kikuchii]|uniref:Uncharacterized protein n=1 Tax=Dendrolimus kikuchii TaxID=765133 RepID=A0ACC1CUI0_9NEOP|nr:hypothetical protein K1T71_009230 [Dendrolimus kikuchii]
MRRIVLFFLISMVYTAFAGPVPRDEQVYPRFIEFPDDNGIMHTVDLEAEPDIELLQEIQRNPANNVYLLYTRRNPQSAQTLVINNAASITSSNFNARVPTIVIAHGWLSNQKSELNDVIRDAALGKYDLNIIVLDWRRLAISDYVTAVRGVPDVGRGLGQFLRFVNQVTGAPFNSMHLAGFSLGSHLVGNAGRELGGRLARVTGLDPAGPLWSSNSNRLGPNDAVYVEAIHTDGGYTMGGLGIGTAIANADFFPNGGISQPGCLTNICNHNRSWEFFSATIVYNHLIGRECSSSLQITLNNCSGRELRMGNNDLRKTGSGMYRVNTGRNYPF